MTLIQAIAPSHNRPHMYVSGAVSMPWQSPHSKDVYLPEQHDGEHFVLEDQRDEQQVQEPEELQQEQHDQQQYKKKPKLLGLLRRRATGNHRRIASMGALFSKKSRQTSSCSSSEEEAEEACPVITLCSSSDCKAPLKSCLRRDAHTSQEEPQQEPRNVHFGPERERAPADQLEQDSGLEMEVEPVPVQVQILEYSFCQDYPDMDSSTLWWTPADSKPWTNKTNFCVGTTETTKKKMRVTMMNWPGLPLVPNCNRPSAVSGNNVSNKVNPRLGPVVLGVRVDEWLLGIVGSPPCRTVAFWNPSTTKTTLTRPVCNANCSWMVVVPPPATTTVTRTRRSVHHHPSANPFAAWSRVWSPKWSTTDDGSLPEFCRPKPTWHRRMSWCARGSWVKRRPTCRRLPHVLHGPWLIWMRPPIRRAIWKNKVHIIIIIIITLRCRRRLMAIMRLRLLRMRMQIIIIRMLSCHLILPTWTWRN